MMKGKDRTKVKDEAKKRLYCVCSQLSSIGDYGIKELNIDDHCPLKVVIEMVDRNEELEIDKNFTRDPSSRINDSMTVKMARRFLINGRFIFLKSKRKKYVVVIEEPSDRVKVKGIGRKEAEKKIEELKMTVRRLRINFIQRNRLYAEKRKKNEELRLIAKEKEKENVTLKQSKSRNIESYSKLQKKLKKVKKDTASSMKSMELELERGKEEREELLKVIESMEGVITDNAREMKKQKDDYTNKIQQLQEEFNQFKKKLNNDNDV